MLEVIENWICEEAAKNYPHSMNLDDPQEYASYQKNISFGEGAEAMYRHLSPELEALKNERDAYRKALEEIFAQNQWNELMHPEVHRIVPFAKLAKDALDQYPPSIVTDKIAE